MYREDKNRIVLFKTIIRVIIAFLILILSIKLVSMLWNNQNIKKQNSSMQDNLIILDTAAKKYFSEDKLPSMVGETIKVDLEELINNKFVDDIIDEDGNKCSKDNSYIQATKLDTEYQIKSYLECNNKSDYINSFIEVKKNIINVEVTKTTITKKKTTKKSTTKKKTTTTITKEKYYQVSFNSNGGNIIPSQTIKLNSRVAEVIPVREGYKFVGWYYKGKEFNIDTIISQDYVLVAKWIKE